jgi:choline dehydrogenase
MLLAAMTALIGIGLRFLFNYEHIPNLVSIDSVKHNYFDYIIIGSGTAGSVMAYKLSKNSNYTVLLIEAGGIFNGLSIVPIMSTLMQGTDMDWHFKSTRQLYSSRGLRSEQQKLPRGRGLGGSHQLNYLLHSNGIQQDFDEWLKVGAKNWTYENLKCFITRHKNDTDTGHCNSADRRAARNLHITSLKQHDSLLSNAFINAYSELNSQTSVTMNLAQFTTKNGKRHTVFHEYLRRAYRHKNLFIMIHATVERIEFNENKEAISVIIRTKSQVATVNVRKEVLLCAGAFNTPHILLRSGIGDARDLKSASIDLIHHAPSVGTNLFDHMNFPLFVSINETASVTKNKILSASEIYRYIVDGQGMLSTTAVVGSARERDYGMILFGMGSADERTLKDVANYKTDTFRAFFPLFGNASQEGFVALSTCLMPKSRGSVRLHENFDNLLIDPAYLKDEYDMECMRNAVKLTLKIVNSRAFQMLDARVHWPQVNACQNFGPFEAENYYPSDMYLECLIRHAGVTAHHPGGTCSIASVVDDNLNVIGVKKLRVVDGSVIPSPISGFPNSIIIAVAERASNIILKSNVL